MLCHGPQGRPPKGHGRLRLWDLLMSNPYGSERRQGSVRCQGLLQSEGWPAECQIPVPPGTLCTGCPSNKVTTALCQADGNWLFVVQSNQKCKYCLDCSGCVSGTPSDSTQVAWPMHRCVVPNFGAQHLSVLLAKTEPGWRASWTPGRQLS
jgi:hypothetical protein